MGFKIHSDLCRKQLNNIYDPVSAEATLLSISVVKRSVRT